MLLSYLFFNKITLTFGDLVWNRAGSPLIPQPMRQFRKWWSLVASVNMPSLKVACTQLCFGMVLLMYGFCNICISKLNHGSLAISSSLHPWLLGKLQIPQCGEEVFFMHKCVTQHCSCYQFWVTTPCRFDWVYGWCACMAFIILYL